jgi:glycosyltransferase involved in cell wall biosynthesis
LGNLVAASVAIRKGACFIFTPHGAYSYEALKRNGLLKYLWLLVESKFANKALAIHAFVDTEAVSICQVAPQATVITSPTPVSLSTESTWQGGGGYIAWLGRYDIEHKGLDIFIKAYRLVPPHLRLPVKMRGRDSTNTLEDVLALVSHYGLDEIISVGGPIEGEEKTIFLNRASFYVMPSRWESLSIALLEALAHNIPCLISDAMPIAGALRDANACYVASNKPEIFAAELIEILKGSRDLNSLRPQQFIRDNLSYEVVGRKFVEQIKLAMARRLDV